MSDTGSTTVPSGVDLVDLVNLTPNLAMDLTPGSGLSITTPERTSDATGQLLIGVSGAGTLAFAPTPPPPPPPTALTHFFGFGGVTSASFTYRARCDSAALVQLRYATQPDFSDALLSPGVTVASGDDFTGGETITGLQANTRYYCTVVVNGVDALYGNDVKTFPIITTDDPITVAFGSCLLAPTSAPILDAVADKHPDLVIFLGDTPYIDSGDLAVQRQKRKDALALGGKLVERITRHYPSAWTVSDHDMTGNNCHGRSTGIANARQAFKETLALYPLVHPTAHLMQVFDLGCARYFATDGRSCRESSRPRYPSTGYWTVQAVNGQTITLPTDGSMAKFPGVFPGYFARVVGKGVWRVTAHPAAYQITIDRPHSIAVGDQIAVKKSNFLDMDNIGSGNQVSALVDGINVSPSIWKFPLFGEVVHKGFTGSGSSDSISGWDPPPDQMELGYYQTHLTAPHVAFLCGDRHHCALDDGINAGFPVAVSSPLDNSNIVVGGGAVYSHGSNALSKGFMLVTYTRSWATFSAYGPTGQPLSGITPMTLTA